MRGGEGLSCYPIAQSVVYYAENQGIQPDRFDSINIALAPVQNIFPMDVNIN